MTASDKLIAEKDGAIGWLTFNNPGRRNALNYAMWDGIAPIIEDFANDPEIRVVVLKGAGGAAFCAGADISEFETARSTPDQVAHYDAAGDRASASIQGIGKPTIAMIGGFCVGGGMGLALDCDLRIAGESARFAIPAAKLGIGYDHLGVGRLVDIVGPSFAKAIFFTGGQFPAHEAHAMGLVNKVTDDDALEAEVRGYCEAIAANAPLSHHCIKTTIDELSVRDRAPDFERCEALVARCFESEDYVEGRRAFLEKRKPVFRGR